MTSNNPVDKVRELQRKLFTAAKCNPGRRFHALFDRIHRGDVLLEAWNRVRSNRGAAGIDGATLKMIEQRGVEDFLLEIQGVLRAGKYRPSPVRRVYIPKPDGRERPLGIPTVRDRVVQMATKIVLEPIFEAGFRDCSYGFRPRRNATQALEMIRVIGGRGHYWVVDADIKGYLDTPSHYPRSAGRRSKRVGAVSETLIRRPLRRPQRTCTALSSLRFTRCNTVCRVTPRMRVASSIGT